MSRPLHPSLSGLYSGADTVNRVMAFLREPKERMERLTESPQVLPLFRQESLIAGLFSELGLDAALSQRLTGTEKPGDVVPSVRAARKTRSDSPEHPVTHALAHGTALPQQAAADAGSSLPGRFTEEKLNGADKAGEKHQLTYTDAKHRLTHNKEADDIHITNLRRTGGLPVDQQSEKPPRGRRIETLYQAGRKEPPFLANDEGIPDRRPADSKLGKIEATTGRNTRLGKHHTAGRNDLLIRSLHTPVVIRESISDDSHNFVNTTSRSPKPASPVPPPVWQARLERLVGKLEAVRQSRSESETQLQAESQNGNGIEFGHTGGLRGLASLGEPMPRKRTQSGGTSFELPDSPAHPPSLDSGHDSSFADELAAVLRREAERCGVSPEEWNQ